MFGPYSFKLWPIAKSALHHSRRLIITLELELPVSEFIAERGELPSSLGCHAPPEYGGVPFAFTRLVLDNLIYLA
eukprot:9326193-Heterocapsa_arctica.AAC.1